MRCLPSLKSAPAAPSASKHPQSSPSWTFFVCVDVVIVVSWPFDSFHSISSYRASVPFKQHRTYPVYLSGTAAPFHVSRGPLLNVPSGLYTSKSDHKLRLTSPSSLQLGPTSPISQFAALVLQVNRLVRCPHSSLHFILHSLKGQATLRLF